MLTLHLVYFVFQLVRVLTEQQSDKIFTLLLIRQGIGVVQRVAVTLKKKRNNLLNHEKDNKKNENLITY